MTTKNAIEILRNMAKKSKAANDLFHSFALRARARGQLTVRGIDLRMRNEGFIHAKKEYADVLKAMSQCGFGKLKYNRRGDVVALVEIRTKLQSIGKSVIGERDTTVKNFAPRNKYSPLPASPAPQVKRVLPEAEERKEEILWSLAGSQALVRAIVSDDQIDEQRKVKLLQELLR